MCYVATRQHRSFRLAPETLERLTRQGRIEGLTLTALVERYVEEGLRQEDHPGIVFVDGPAGRRARVAGTGLDVWEVVETVEDNEGSTAEAADYLAIPERLVLVAMRYYADFPYEIDAWSAENERLFDEEVARMRRVAEATR
jgi:uncharacterized protein (DUF433 family)